mmetsp:Transcript_73621/g.239702  ORF Transcript_73621/g.239702 Transcript_73621/m.239702 type:complete len:434 (+) Transcript_73621:108-1409(+)
MRHSACGIEPHELSAPLVQQHKHFSFIMANRTEEEDAEQQKEEQKAQVQKQQNRLHQQLHLQHQQQQQQQHHQQQQQQQPRPQQQPGDADGTVGPEGVESATPAIGHPVVPKKSKSWRKVVLQVFVFTSVWWMAAILVIMEIKQTVTPEGIFPYPFALTSIVQPCCGFAAYLLSLFYNRRRRPSPPLSWTELAMLLALGGLQGFEIGLTNKALEFLTVAGRTMVSSTSVLFMMATARMWGLERLGLLRLCSAALLLLGGFFQGYGQQSDKSSNIVGIMMQAVSMLLSSQRWALAQFILQRSPLDSALGQISKLQLLSRTLPVTGLVCLPLAIWLEPGAYTYVNLMQPVLHFRVVVIAAALTAMLYAELKLVNLLSAVAFNVLATIHQIPIVLAGVLLQHNHVDLTSTYGFAACLLGALVYAAARHQDRLHLED